MEQTRSKVIVVGRANDSRRFLVEELTARGYFAVGSRDPDKVKEYLSMPPAKHYDLVILDFQVKESGNGVVLHHFLQEKEIPLLIIMESNSIPEKCQSLVGKKGVLFVPRPFILDDFLTLVRQLCRQETFVEMHIR